MTAGPARKRFPWLGYGLVLAVIVLVALGPVISVYLAYLVAEPNGCRLDEAGVYPCVINGVDYGGLLAGMAIMGWLMLASIPFGAVALAVWVIVLLVHLLYWRRANPKRNPS
ncbi:hypothetical protein [Pelagibacterium lacus]|uniref:Uncharacterized protein n=1 Tax=Pelagibacterium lacus TaxID=2282655 RepID=A0A369W1I2_9HYPH|nr:hypothetical protein [Pelagibacterium lacus]RDE08544.1 hypothetical protein DVH29_11055 [Pelagibacterium lacus]